VTRIDYTVDRKCLTFSQLYYSNNYNNIDFGGTLGGIYHACVACICAYGDNKNTNILYYSVLHDNNNNNINNIITLRIIQCV